MISLTELFARLNEKHFGGELPPIPLHWNSRLRSSSGRFFPGSRKWIGEYPPRIEIASYLLELEDAVRLVEDTLGHELVHYWLWVRKRPYGHTAEFKEKLKAIGSSRYNPVPRLRLARFIYECPGCKKEFRAKRRLKGLACLACCKQFAGGKFAEAYRLQFVAELPIEKRKRRRPVVVDVS